ncbi:hypothetical protein KEM55_003071 [Ascosphaera atra]|nr:hypothetical protein KEM55_003071 [Ascosphaera atra]
MFGFAKFFPFSDVKEGQFPDAIMSLADAPRAVSPNTAEKMKGVDEASATEKGIPAATPSVSSEQAYSSYTLEALRQEIELEVEQDGHDSVYDRKCKAVNKAMTDIGMGRYQWKLFILCGFGWCADNIWLQGVALTLPQLQLEFGVEENWVRFTTCSLFAGLTVGAAFWGIASDLVGRRIAFNVTLFICAAFGLASAGGPTWVGTCILYACLGLGVGGNLPVDGALFLEYLPMASNNLVTMLSAWWGVGNLIASVVAWGFIPNYTCEADLKPCSKVADGQPCCAKKDNMGWRYMVLTLGGISMFMFLCRFLFFTLYESPKYLLSKNRQSDAVASVQAIAHANKTKTWLTSEILEAIGGIEEEVAADNTGTTMDIIKRTLSRFSTRQFRPLFESKRLGWTTVLLWFCWATIGLGYPLFNSFLPQYIKNAGGGSEQSTNTVYRNYTITAAVGVPGSICACFVVDIPKIGRRGTMAAATLITGVLLFCFTASTNPDIQLVCSSLEAFFQNIMYGVLYAYTPEVFPAPNRGTATGVSSCLNRLAGVCAPIVAIYGAKNASAPIYASGGLMLAAFVAMCALPIETRGRQAM